MIHRSMWIPCLGVLLVAGWGLPTGQAAAPPHYVITNLGGPNVADVSGTGLNAGGWTTGATWTAQGYVWADLVAPDGTITSLGDPAFDETYGDVINANRQIAGIGFVSISPRLFRYTPGVGYDVNLALPGSNGYIGGLNQQGDILATWFSNWTPNEIHFLLYTNERGLEDLSTLAGGPVFATGINDLRQVVGSRGTAPNTHGFLLQDHQWTDLGTLGGLSSNAYYVANTGTVVGEAAVAGNQLHAFRYTAARGMEDLQNLPGAVTSKALLISSTGTIVGTYMTAQNTERPFYYRDQTGMRDMGFELISAWGGVSHVNAYDEMVGLRQDEVCQVHAFYFSPATGDYLLDSLVPSLPWAITTVAGINDAGQVLVTGYYQGHETTALLTPVWTGDTNCDRAVNFADINGFVQMLSDPVGWQAANPTCALANGDINGDGVVDFRDIDGFVALLTAP